MLQVIVFDRAVKTAHDQTGLNTVISLQATPAARTPCPIDYHQLPSVPAGLRAPPTIYHFYVCCRTLDSSPFIVCCRRYRELNVWTLDAPGVNLLQVDGAAALNPPRPPKPRRAPGVLSFAARDAHNSQHEIPKSNKRAGFERRDYHSFAFVMHVSHGKWDFATNTIVAVVRSVQSQTLFTKMTASFKAREQRNCVGSFGPCLPILWGSGVMKEFHVDREFTLKQVLTALSQDGQKTNDPGRLAVPRLFETSM